MHSNLCIWGYFGFLVVLIAGGAEVKALSPRISSGNKPVFGVSSSSSPLLSLSSKNSANDDGHAVNNGVDSSDDSGAIDFLGQAEKISQPTKSDLYDDDELAGLLDLHQQLQSVVVPPPQESIESTTTTSVPQTIDSPNDLFAGGLHDLILQTIDEIEEETEEPQAQSWISDNDKDKFSKLDIIAVASDVDGTIIGFDQTIHPRTTDSIKAAMSQKGNSELKWIFPATGKTRWGARNSLGPELACLTDGPGVYCQVREVTTTISSTHYVCFVE
jgi:hypothetical protein